jgi:hypothetical protein
MTEEKPMREVTPVKDEENQQPIPTAWRPVFREVVRHFVDRDYCIRSGIKGVALLSDDTASQIEEYISDYGEVLTELPEETWDTSVCMWMGNRWDVLIDLWTLGEGRSDLVLSARVSESEEGFLFDIGMVYVP